MYGITHITEVLPHTKMHKNMSKNSHNVCKS